MIKVTTKTNNYPYDVCYLFQNGPSNCKNINYMHCLTKRGIKFLLKIIKVDKAAIEAYYKNLDKK